MRLEKVFDQEGDNEEGFRFLWYKNKKADFRKGLYIPTEMLFEAMAKAAKKGMIK